VYAERGRARQGPPVKQGSGSFLKKEPKYFYYFEERTVRAGTALQRERGSKSFLLLFFKKEALVFA
jgi:hypothetical protein